MNAVLALLFAFGWIVVVANAVRQTLDRIVARRLLKRAGVPGMGRQAAADASAQQLLAALSGDATREQPAPVGYDVRELLTRLRSAED
jgi:hypothetical protein